MAQLTIDLTGKDGLADNFTGDRHRTSSQPNLRYKASEGQMVEGVYNPLMYDGYLAPSNDSIQDMILSANPDASTRWISSMVDYDTKDIFFANVDEDVYASDNVIVGTPSYVYNPLDVVRFNVAENLLNNPYDLISYEINGTKKYFYISSDDVGIANSGSWGSPDRDWLSTVANGGDNLVGNGIDSFLRLADNGFLYVLDEYAVHKIDGTATGGANATATMNTLVFPESLVLIRDAVDTRGKMYIAMNTPNVDVDDSEIIYTGPTFCGVYIWNRISAVASIQDFITIPDALAITNIWVHTDGVVHIGTIGSNKRFQIRKFTGNSFTVVKELGPNTRPNHRNSLTTGEGLTLWAGNDGYIYGYGNLNSRSASVGNVYKLAQFATGTITSPTMLECVGGDSFDTTTTGTTDVRPSLYIAYEEDDGVPKISRWFFYGTGTLVDNNGDDDSGLIDDLEFKANAGNVYTPVTYLPGLSTVKNLVIYCAPGTTSDSTTVATMKVYVNQSSTATITKTLTKSEIARGYVTIDINKPYVNAIQFEIEWDTDLIIGTDDFLPSVGILTYEPTETHSKDDG